LGTREPDNVDDVEEEPVDETDLLDEPLEDTELDDDTGTALCEAALLDEGIDWLTELPADCDAELSDADKLPTELPNIELPLAGIELPDMELPGKELPGMLLPGMELPDMLLPGMELPDMLLPGMELPGMLLPGMELPIMELPGMLLLPGRELPGIELPGIELPAIELPDNALNDPDKLDNPAERLEPWDRLPREEALKEPPELEAEALPAPTGLSPLLKMMIGSTRICGLPSSSALSTGPIFS